MSNANPSRDPVADLFREVVLVLGGVFAARGTDDETIRQLARGLERVYRRAREKAAPATGGGPGHAPHPAITGLLRLTEEEP